LKLAVVIVDSYARHSGARALAREPGIQESTPPGPWIPGSQASLAPRNDDQTLMPPIYRSEPG
jgi:hypothetical protein